VSRETYDANFQRARIIRTNEHAELLGRELWVKAGPPERRPLRDIEGKRPVCDDPAYETHLFDDFGNPVWVSADQVELLSRSEKDFVRHVVVEYWRDFMLKRYSRR
jgi:hypothetical protein